MLPRLPRSSVIPALLAVMTLMIVFMRARSCGEPIDCDSAIYTVIAREMLKGRLLYTDLFDIKPPLIFITYAAAQLTTEFPPHQLALLTFVSATVTLIGLYFAAREATGRRLAGLMAAAAWVLVSGDLRLEANQPNTEVFMNAALVWGFFFFLKYRTGNGKDPSAANWLLCSGVCFGIATCFKQVAAVVPLILCFLPSSNSRSSTKEAALRVGLLNLPGVVFWAGTAAYFVHHGRFTDFYDVLVGIGKVYAQDREMAAAEPYWHTPIPPATYYLFAVMAVWLAVVITNKRRRNLLLGGAWLGATVLAVVLPGKYFAHYFQLYLPVTCWMAGVAVASLPAKRHIASLGLAIVILAGLAALRLPEWTLSKDDMSRLKYGERFIHARELAFQLRSRIPTGTPIFVYGMDAEYYYYLNCPPASGIMNVFPLYRGDLTAKFNQRVIDDLQRTKAPFVIVDLTAMPSPFLKWLDANYHPIASEEKTVVVQRNGYIAK